MLLEMLTSLACSVKIDSHCVNGSFFHTQWLFGLNEIANLLWIILRLHPYYLFVEAEQKCSMKMSDKHRESYRMGIMVLCVDTHLRWASAQFLDLWLEDDGRWGDVSCVCVSCTLTVTWMGMETEQESGREWLKKSELTNPAANPVWAN